MTHIAAYVAGLLTLPAIFALVVWCARAGICRAIDDAMTGWRW